MVFGFGEKKTPDAFRNACHRFVFIEVLREDVRSSGDETDKGARDSSEAARPTSGSDSPAGSKAKFPRKFMLAALEESSDDSGWARLSTFGSYLTKLQPDFDSRLYGYRKLSDLVRARGDIFVTEQRESSGSNQKVLYVRAR